MGTAVALAPKNKPLQFKRATKKAFEKANLLLLDGQPAFEVDTGKLKIGDGNTRYLNLGYIGNTESGKDGKSAYEIWLEAGNTGTVYDFLNSIVGKSAYQVWLDLGNKGTEEDFIFALKGKSAYQEWLDLGNEGTKEDFIASLKGKSAYQVWLDEGNEGSEEDFISSLKGKSSYQSWLDGGNEGTEEDFVTSLKGDSAFEQWKKEFGKPDSTFEEFVIYLKTTSWGEF